MMASISSRCLCERLKATAHFNGFVPPTTLSTNASMMVSTRVATARSSLLLVFCKVKLKQINSEIANSFVRRIQYIPEVTECYNTSGTYDYLLKVRARDMKQYQEFLLTKLGDIDSVAAIESMFVMSEVKQCYGINI